MKKVNIILIVALFSSVIFFSMAEATRIFNEKLLPENVAIIDKGIKYIPNFYYDSSRGTMHYVEAWDVETGKKIWEQKIYEIIFDLSFEQDVQERFIISLEVRDNKLIVVTEAGGRYVVDLKTREVAVISKEQPALNPFP